MARIVTVESIMTASLNLADRMGDPSFTRVELIDRIDRSVAELHEILVSRLEERYAYATYDFTTARGTGSYAAPPDMMKLYGVDLYPTSGTSGQPMRLRRSSFQGRQDFSYDPWNSYWNAGYDLRGDGVYLTPTPTAAQTVRVHYAPTLPSLTTGSQQFNGISGWDDWVVASTARHILAHDKCVEPTVERMLQEARQRIEEHSSVRQTDEEPLPDSGGWD